MHNVRFGLPVAGCLLAAAMCLEAQPAAAQSKVLIEAQDGKAVVTIDGELFTEYVFEGFPKPILYPIIGPHKVEMTRNYPMKEDVDNEAHDHPHHQSLWFTHDDVNGANFWSAHESRAPDGKMARIVQTAMTLNGNAIHAESDWRDAEGKVVCQESRVMTFGVIGTARYIDLKITISATNGDVTFGDTKEGTMAIRTNPLLRITNSENQGNHTASGHAVNSEGHHDAELWGKRAKWVDYFAPVGEHVVGIGIFDHPTNPRHPTWWHARTYGLVAANPFGIHDFEKQPAGTGNLTIKNGDKLTFRYRFVFHEGNAEAAEIAKRYEEFAGE